MKLYLSLEEVRQSPEFADYYQEAKLFCAFLEESNYSTTANFLAATRSCLLRLYAAASAMPWLDLQSNEEYEEKLSVDDFEDVLQITARQLSEARYYWHIFNPLDELNTVPVCGDLLDDLTDIYKDLKYSLMIFGVGKTDCEENALWQLKYDFDAHWSRHCINALSAIHFYLRKIQQAA